MELDLYNGSEWDSTDEYVINEEYIFSYDSLVESEILLRNAINEIRKLDLQPNEKFCEFIVSEYDESLNNEFYQFPAYDVAHRLYDINVEPTYKQRRAIINTIIVHKYGVKTLDVVYIWNQSHPENIYF